MNADVIGLMEMENDGTGANSAIQDLVNGLNEATIPGTYAFVPEPAPGVFNPVTEVHIIKVSIIYKTATVAPAGPALNYQIEVEPYGQLYDRPPLAQTFQEIATGEQFSVIVNHFKSKSGCPTNPDDPDWDLGQGCFNHKRTIQAEYMLDLVEQLEAIDPDVFVLGDLNAYALEDPVVTLTNGGLISQEAALVPPEQNYTYIFDGQSGNLDHILATEHLAAQVAGATIWHINADEPSVIDYNKEFKPQDFYEPTPFRSSDHDPILIGLSLAKESIQMGAFHSEGDGMIDLEYTTAGPIPGFDLGIYLSADAIFDAGDVLQGSLITLDDPLDVAPGSHVKSINLFELSLPDEMTGPDDDYYLLAVADPLNDILEENETDNTAQFFGAYLSGGNIAFIHSTDGPDSLSISADGQLTVNTAVLDLNGAQGYRAWTHAGDDTLDGKNAPVGVRFYAGPGADSLYGSAFNDILNGGLGVDVAAFRSPVSSGVVASLTSGTASGHGSDLLVAIEALIGSPYADSLTGSDQIDVLNGAEGDDQLFGKNGNDQLFGAEGADTLYGGLGDDQLNGDAGADRLYGEQGNDTLYGGADQDFLYGGPGIDHLYGEGGNDQLYPRISCLERGVEFIDGGTGINKAYIIRKGDTILNVRAQTVCLR